jgi:hypothetical protein
MKWIIRCAVPDSDGYPQYWSNEWGWTRWKWATVFTDVERASLRLPLDGQWVER